MITSFIILGSLVCLLALATIFSRSPIAASMLLILLMFLLAGMFALLGAHFSAVAQVIVYAGAIMVVFVFVIMLLNIPISKIAYERIKISEIALFIATIAIAVTPLFFLHNNAFKQLLPTETLRPPYYSLESGENVKNIAALMFTDYLWAFELISLVILIAIIGAVAVTKKEKHT